MGADGKLGGLRASQPLRDLNIRREVGAETQ